MRRFYYRAPAGNFGDDLNRWLWDEVLPGCWDEGSELNFSGIGTILAPWMPRERHWVIFTSGTGYGPPAVDLHDPDVHVIAVRGPLTARALGLPASAALTDGAILLSLLERFAPVPEADRQGVVFVPHHSAFSAGNWEEAARLAGVVLVDPRGDCEGVLQAIRSARLVVADSMHAAIAADTMRVPWVPVTTSPEINSFKWLDWSLSMELPYEPTALPPSTALERWRSFRIGRRAPAIARSGDPVREAMAAYRQVAARGAERKRRLSFLTSRISTLLLAHGPARLAERRLEAAAAALAAAAARTGLLSDRSLFEARRDEVVHRLGLVGEHARRFAGKGRA